MSGAIIVLSGPSGAGKSTLINAMVEDIGAYYFSLSTTTRAPRKGELEGVHYHFCSKEEFKADILAEHFLEHAVVHGNYYGTSIKPVEEALKEGKLVIFDIDVQGHENVKKRLGDITTSVFITTPSYEELERRLHSRGTDDKEVIDNRLSMAINEVTHIAEFDYFIVNDDLQKAIKEIKAVAQTAKLKKGVTALNAFKTLWHSI